MANTAKTQKKQALNLKTVKNKYAEIHDNLLDVSQDTIDSTVKNVEKWQNLIAKSIKRSTPIVEKNMDITFDTLETIAKQYKKGGQRVKSLLGLGEVSFKRKPVTSKKSTVATKATNVSKNAGTTASKPVTKKAVKTATKSTPKAAVKTETKNTVANTKVTAVNGIGPKIESLLNEKGIKSIQDLAKANLTVLNEVLDSAGPRFQMHDPSTWIKQAQELSK